MKNYFALAFFCIIQPLIAIAEDSPHSAGVIFGPTFIMNSTSIPIIPGADDCGTFHDGTAISYFGGLFYSYELMPDLLSINAQLFYEYRSADLSATTSGYEVFSSATNSYVPLIRKHSYSGSLEYISMDIGAKYRPLEDIPAYLRFGFEAGNPIISSDYKNIEQIASPQGILFPNETLTNTIASGAITNSTTALAISLGVSYSYILNSGIIVEPSLTFRKAINSILNNSDWNQDIIRLGIALGMNFQKSMPIKRPDTHIVETTIIQPKVEKINLIQSLKTRIILTQETVVTQTYPILPYIFFDSLATTLKPSYIKNKTSNFIESELPKDNLEIYYRMLDIIANRMIINPEINLKIDGTQDGSERVAFPNNSLSISRAKEVSEYLTKNWKIQPERIQIGAINKPTLATSEVYPEGYQENRRVELTSNSSKLFQPVVHTKYSEFKWLSDDLVISSTLASDNLNWIIRFEYDNSFLKEYSGKGKLPTSFKVSELFANTKFGINKSLKMVLTVVDDKSNTETSSKIVPIELEKNKFELGRLNLIVFDFDKSEINDSNTLMIENFASTAINNTSLVNITGSTDKLGEINYNQKLSMQRAENVKALINRINPDIKINEIKGVGASELLYDNATPEGRFYSRTVFIEVRTPIQ